MGGRPAVARLSTAGHLLTGNLQGPGHTATQCLAKPTPELKVSKLQYVNATVNGNKAVALCDSGSQIPTVSSRLPDVSDNDKMGTVNLQVVVGDAVTVTLISVSVKLSGDEQCEQVMEELQLLCAVIDLGSSTQGGILSPVLFNIYPDVLINRLAVMFGACMLVA